MLPLDTSTAAFADLRPIGASGLAWGPHGAVAAACGSTVAFFLPDGCAARAPDLQIIEQLSPADGRVVALGWGPHVHVTEDGEREALCAWRVSSSRLEIATIARAPPDVASMASLRLRPAKLVLLPHMALPDKTTAVGLSVCDVAFLDPSWVVVTTSVGLFAVNVRAALDGQIGPVVRALRAAELLAVWPRGFRPISACSAEVPRHAADPLLDAAARGLDASAFLFVSGHDTSAAIRSKCMLLSLQLPEAGASGPPAATICGSVRVHCTDVTLESAKPLGDPIVPAAMHLAVVGWSAERTLLELCVAGPTTCVVADMTVAAAAPKRPPALVDVSVLAVWGVDGGSVPPNVPFVSAGAHRQDAMVESIARVHPPGIFLATSSGPTPARCAGFLLVGTARVTAIVCGRAPGAPGFARSATVIEAQTEAFTDLAAIGGVSLSACGRAIGVLFVTSRTGMSCTRLLAAAVPETCLMLNAAHAALGEQRTLKNGNAPTGADGTTDECAGALKAALLDRGVFVGPQTSPAHQDLFGFLVDAAIAAAAVSLLAGAAVHPGAIQLLASPDSVRVGAASSKLVVPDELVACARHLLTAIADTHSMALRPLLSQQGDSPPEGLPAATTGQLPRWQHSLSSAVAIYSLLENTRLAQRIARGLLLGQALSVVGANASAAVTEPRRQCAAAITEWCRSALADTKMSTDPLPLVFTTEEALPGQKRQRAEAQLIPDGWRSSCNSKNPSVVANLSALFSNSPSDSQRANSWQCQMCQATLSEPQCPSQECPLCRGPVRVW